MQGKISDHGTKDQHVLSGEENITKNDMIKVSHDEQMSTFLIYTI